MSFSLQNLNVAQQIMNQLNQLQTTQQAQQVPMGGQQDTPKITTNPSPGQRFPAPIQPSVAGDSPSKPTIDGVPTVQPHLSTQLQVPQSTSVGIPVQQGNQGEMVQIQLPAGLQIHLPNLQQMQARPVQQEELPQVDQLVSLELRQQQQTQLVQQINIDAGPSPNSGVSEGNLQQVEYKDADHNKTVPALISPHTPYPPSKYPIQFLSNSQSVDSRHTDVSLSDESIEEDSEPPVESHSSREQNSGLYSDFLTSESSSMSDRMKSHQVLNIEPIPQEFHPRKSTQRQIPSPLRISGNPQETYVHQDFEKTRAAGQTAGVNNREWNQDMPLSIQWRSVLKESEVERSSNETENAISKTSPTIIYSLPPNELIQERAGAEMVLPNVGGLTHTQDKQSCSGTILLTGNEKSQAINQIMSGQYRSHDGPKEYRPLSHKHARSQKLRNLDKWKQQRSKVAQEFSDCSYNQNVLPDEIEPRLVAKHNEQQSNISLQKPPMDIPANVGLRKIAPRREMTLQLMHVESVSEQEALISHSDIGNENLTYLADGIHNLTHSTVVDPSRNIVQVPLNQQQMPSIRNSNHGNGNHSTGLQIYDMPIQALYRGYSASESRSTDESPILVRSAESSSPLLSSQDSTMSLPGLNITLMPQESAQQRRDTPVVENSNSRQVILPLQGTPLPNMNYAVFAPDDPNKKSSTVANSGINFIPVACSNAGVVYTTTADSDRYQNLSVFPHLAETSTIPTFTQSTTSMLESPSSGSDARTITIDAMSLSPEILQSLAQGYSVTLQQSAFKR